MKKLEGLLDKNRKLETKLKEFSEILDNLTSTEDRKKALWKEVYENAIEDRESASLLVNDLLITIPGSMAHHQSVGTLMTKYLERMAKCNDQILKLAELVAKEQEKEDVISPSAIFDSIGD